jgi:hypothetical protein
VRAGLSCISSDAHLVTRSQLVIPYETMITSYSYPKVNILSRSGRYYL